ncbi:uncharacterized protein LOC100828959 [Brachypodium distachyon]|uniref:C2H2-type domain-containing protein n=1 Tax=Brachypodium distachyon TaxID=15368 RepID=A0A0Q3E5Z3_BRADI|nr:uncharacterized protein LOC100828959 [Brachypodium distachyon]KQJ81628.1 hypothetical protein BRADI_5g01872v3 [Brachypodium distachyon]|eukprot:XP_014750892.1 uncharacterized protein LOC100828959 [Brachypodium distachyon]
MALSTLLLPTAASAADTSDRRRQHHGKRKKKPPPSPSPRTTPPPAARTSTSGSRHRAAASPSKIKSPAAAMDASSKLGAAGKSHQRHHSKPSKKAAASSSSSSSSSSWEQLKSLLSCRSATAAARVHDPAASSSSARLRAGGACGASLCSIRDVLIDGGASASSVASSAAPLNRSSRRTHRSVTPSSTGGHPSSLRGLSGCYECRAINVEPVSRRYPRPRELCPCSQCGEVFTKAESLEHHLAIRHAVSELGPEDSGRNIVEIIFKSSWRQQRQSPVGMGAAMCQIERILKVHNPARTVARFESYRDAVRARCRAATAATTRAAADGNELLRFHPARLSCALGLAGSSSLCSSTTAADDTDPQSASATPSGNGECCGVCAAIRHGFAPWAGEHALGVRTTASSGRAHQGAGAAGDGAGSARAMLVCRVIAGQVRKAGGEEEGLFDSVAGEEDGGGAYGSMEELFVANPRAILPCFVVIYRVAAPSC